MAMVQINWNPGRAEMRSFALSIFIGFTIISWVIWYAQGLLGNFRETGVFDWGLHLYLWGIPSLIALISLIDPRLGKPFYLFWMGLAFVMGNVMSHVLLTLIYYVIFTPTGLIMRLVGYDPLRIRKPIEGSNWVDHGKAYKPEHCKRLY